MASGCVYVAFGSRFDEIGVMVVFRVVILFKL